MRSLLSVGLLFLLVCGITSCGEDLVFCGSDQPDRRMFCHMEKQKPTWRSSSDIQFLYLSEQSPARMSEILPSMLDMVVENGQYLAVGGTEPISGDILEDSIPYMRDKLDGVYMQVFLPKSNQSERILSELTAAGAKIDFFDVSFLAEPE